MNLNIKENIKKNIIWIIILLSIFVMIEFMVIMTQNNYNEQCKNATDYKFIIGCAGIENNVDNSLNNEKYLKYLQSKKNIISKNQNIPPYILLNYYLKILESSSISKEEKIKDYNFLMEQAKRCRLIDSDCTNLYIIMLEKAMNKSLLVEDKVIIYEDYLRAVNIDNHVICVIEINYIYYKKLIEKTRDKDKFESKFKKCVHLERLN